MPCNTIASPLIFFRNFSFMWRNYWCVLLLRCSAVDYCMRNCRIFLNIMFYEFSMNSFCIRKIDYFVNKWQQLWFWRVYYVKNIIGNIAHFLGLCLEDIFGSYLHNMKFIYVNFYEYSMCGNEKFVFAEFLLFLIWNEGLKNAMVNSKTAISIWLPC